MSGCYSEFLLPNQFLLSSHHPQNTLGIACLERNAEAWQSSALSKGPTKWLWGSEVAQPYLMRMQKVFRAK